MSIELLLSLNASAALAEEIAAAENHVAAPADQQAVTLIQQMSADLNTILANTPPTSPPPQAYDAAADDFNKKYQALTSLPNLPAAALLDVNAAYMALRGNFPTAAELATALNLLNSAIGALS